MKVLRIILALLLLLVVAVGLGGFVLFNEVTRGPLPQLDGEVVLAGRTVAQGASETESSLAIPGLNDTVTIIRDAWGVPHIYASNLNDLYYAQGYTQAQDRWWQMAFYRAIGSGRIQELTGGNAEALGSDIFIRTIGWRRASERDLAEAYDAETLAALQAFADGVNAYIFSRPQDDLALAYTLLGLTGVQIEIEPWTPADTVTFTKVMAWNLVGGMTDLERAELIERVGEAMVADYAPEWPFGRRPTIVHPDDMSPAEADLTRRDATSGTAGAAITTRLAGGVRPDAGFGMVMGSDIGSNNWVVSGDLTVSGKPILANDPHLGIQMPSIWYEISLHCQPVSEACPLNARGFTFALSPTVITGHNERIAWGVTNVGPDVLDLFRVEVNPDNPLQYRWDGAWRDMTVHEEVIRVGDSDATVTIQVRETHLGPIINDNDLNDDGQPTGFNNDDPMALRWTALDPDTTVTAFMRIAIASDWDEFRDGLAYYGAPSQNFVYADVDGNIGYQVPGRIPVRPAANDGLLPIAAVDDSTTWLGYLPYDELPRLYNPERGYIASANQAVVPLDYYDDLAERLAEQFGADANYRISSAWDYGYRGARIEALLAAETTHSIETTRRIQTDNYHLGAAELMPYLTALDIADPALAEARDWLATWDFVAHQDSPHAVYYATFWKRLMHSLFDDQLGEDYRVTGGGQEWWATALLLDDPDNIWWDDATTPDAVETRDDLLIRALDEGYALAREALGEDRDAWRWGALHGATFVSQPLGVSGIGLVEGLVNRGPYPTGGGVSIVNATRWDTSADDFGVIALPSYRMIVDLSDLDAGLSIHSTGQSGHPYSPHYDDMIAPWAALDYKPMLFSRAQVEAAAAHTLTLRP